MAYDQSVRTLMNNAGYSNDKIGYDTNSGTVTYAGQPFLKPQMNVNGTTYTDQSTFNNAHNQFKQANPGLFNTSQPSWMNSAENSMPIDQRFAYYASNPDKGNAELSRVNTKIGYLNGLSNYDPAAAQNLKEANQYKQSLLSVLGQNAQTPQTGQAPQFNDLIGKIYQQVTNPQQFDPYSSPQYQSAQNQANYETQQNIRAAQEALGTAGIGRSSTLQDDAQRFGQEAQQRLMTQVVPQIIQQQRELEQQRVGNLENLLSPLMQQQQNAIQNKFAEAGLTGQLNGQQTLAGQQAQAALTGLLANGNKTYAAQQQDIQNALARANAFGQVTDPADAQLLGVPLGTDTKALIQLMNQMKYQNAELGIRQQANNIAAQRAGNQANHYSAMDNYYNARANNSGSNAAQARNDLESQYISNLEQMTPDNRASFFKNEKANIVKDLGTSGYNQLYNSYFDQYGTPK